jgi:hypothetical protein
MNIAKAAIAKGGEGSTRANLTPSRANRRLLFENGTSVLYHFRLAIHKKELIIIQQQEVPL